MKSLVIIVVVGLLASCKSSSAPPPPPTPPAPVGEKDHVEVLARHKPPAMQEDLDSDPVVVHFTKFKVTKARFDPDDLVGGSATVELDLASIDTGSAERDDDLRSPAFFDVAKFATATIDVANVKRASGAHYTADATVAMHGATKTFPVTFDVLGATPDGGIRVKAEHAFSRLDFNVGVDPATDPTERIATGLTIQMVLTLKPTT